MTVADFLDEADLELATLRQVLDTAQHALDVAERTQRAGHRIRRIARKVVVATLVALVGAGVVYAVRTVLTRREDRLPGTTGPVEVPSVPATPTTPER